MQNTVILLVTHRGLRDETTESIERLKCPSVVKILGCPDQSKARSMGVEQALDGIAGTAIDTILLIDDDMVFDAVSVEKLVSESRRTGEPCSGVAMTKDGKLCARPLRQLVITPGSPTRWLTGLGCLAVPRALLQRLRNRLPSVAGITQWCRSGQHPDYPGEWFPNDFWFCHHFGGVLLLPVPFGHVKSMPIWPDERTLREVMRYRGE